MPSTSRSGYGLLINGMGLLAQARVTGDKGHCGLPGGLALDGDFVAPRASPSARDRTDTVADGIRCASPSEALEIMRTAVDEVMLVTDDEIIEAMRLLHRLPVWWSSPRAPPASPDRKRVTSSPVNGSPPRSRVATLPTSRCVSGFTEAHCSTYWEEA